MQLNGGQDQMITQGHLDDLAREYHRTKDPELKKLWYEKVKEWANGSYNLKRRIVSVSSVNKRDDGTYLIIGKSRLP